MQKNKHICIFLAFQEFDIIRQAFESNYIDDIDFFIIENKSKNSDKIKNYFLNKNLIGYIQFEKNISFNAMNIFINDYFEFLKEYDYITFTDGDLFLYNAKDTFQELIYILNNFNSTFVSVPLYLDNHYKSKNRIIGIDRYNDIMKLRYEKINYSYLNGHTSNTFITLKNKDLYLIKDIKYIDMYLKKKLDSLNLKWLKIQKNKAYHLTWDLYQEGNKYFEWKKQVIFNIWTDIRFSKYNKIK